MRGQWRYGGLFIAQSAAQSAKQATKQAVRRAGWAAVLSAVLMVGGLACLSGEPSAGTEAAAGIPGSAGSMDDDVAGGASGSEASQGPSGVPAEGGESSDEPADEGGMPVGETAGGRDDVRALLNLPQGVVSPAVPDHNPLTGAKIALGRYLFYDEQLSGNGTQSCASCHEQRLAFTDDRRTSVGSSGTSLARNSMSLANVAYFSTLTWAHNGFFTLEAQIPVPLLGTTPIELGVTDRNRDEVLSRFADDPMYAEMFQEAFPDGGELVTINKIVYALASFCRSLISLDSRYDRFAAGDKSALTENELAGLALFEGERFECFHCHSGVLFSNAYRDERIPESDVRAQFFNTGLYNVDDGGYPSHDQGLYELTFREQDRGLFRPPSLRNVEVTGPYMHDGSMETLREVVEHYVAGGRVITEGPFAGDGRLNPHKSSLVRAIAASDQEIEDLVAFLRTLTDEGFLTNPEYASPFVK